MNFNLKYMYRCLQLAEYGAGYVAPNPMVGAVLVVDDRIIGEGYHQRYGEPHAEPNAIRSVTESDKHLLKSATLYVNLEPCSHYGKTPPCADLIVKSGIPRVVIGTLDPNPRVAGRGVHILRNAGVEVEVGVLSDACYELNKRFFIFQERERPFILLKWAQTKDGFIDYCRLDASEKPLAISNRITSQLTHKMRSENQSILIATNTVLLDNPSLTVRNWSGRNPIRMAIDRRNTIPANYHILDGKVSTIIFTENGGESKSNVEYVMVDFESNVLENIIQEIYKRNIHSVLVEGGAMLLNSFINSGLWDEANVEISDQCIESGVPVPVVNLQPVSHDKYDGHEWLHYKNLTS